ncbi:MAG: hypothetical protein KDK25_13785, partial [Leptospiraceae bacterium]|nr:hypothetical protein [Leptospiraceae bacterium]
MASKKDKFRKEVKKSLGQEDPSMEGIVGEIAGRRTEKSRRETESTDGPEMLVETDAPSLASPSSEVSAMEEASAPKLEAGQAAGSQDEESESSDENASDAIAKSEEEARTSRVPVEPPGKKESESRRIGASGTENQSREGRSASSERIDPVAEHKKTGARHMARKRD